MDSLINRRCSIRQMPNRAATRSGDEKNIGGILGLVAGGVVGNFMGGWLLVVVVAGLGGLLGYYVGGRFKPMMVNRRP